MFYLNNNSIYSRRCVQTDLELFCMTVTVQRYDKQQSNERIVIVFICCFLRYIPRVTSPQHDVDFGKTSCHVNSYGTSLACLIVIFSIIRGGGGGEREVGCAM
jgi:hypothetical protein